MTRAEFVQRLVLNEISDDFENDQVILREVSKIGNQCDLTIQRCDVVDALKVLVEEGLAKAYDLSHARDVFAGELKDMPSLNEVEEDFKTYFYITKQGMTVHQTDSAWWPLDDDGELRPDWNPPTRP